MWRCLTDIKFRWLRFVTISITLLVLIGVPTIMLIIPSDTVVASQPRQSQISPLPTLLSSPSVTSNPSTSSTQNAQDQEVVAQAKQDVSTANALIGFAGLFVAVVAVIVVILSFAATVAGFVGVMEVRQIRKLRMRFETDNKRVNRLRTEFETDNKRINQLRTEFENDIGRIDKLVTSFEEQLVKVTLHTTEIESKNQLFQEQLEKVAQHTTEIENKNKTLMEASYFFDLATNAYKIGDNVRAIEYYKRSLQLQPDNIKVMERLGRAYSNLNDMESAIKYLEDALKIDPQNVTALRSLALCYRYSDRAKAIEYLKLSLDIHPEGYEAWDFLGLLYRDQKYIDEAISAHEQALRIQKRPETEFYLGILLLYSPKGDKIRARSLMLSAYQRTLEQEHDLRIRPVWKILIHAGIPIIAGKKEEALEIILSLTLYITTQRIYEALKGHLQFLLEGTDHHEWIPEIMEIVKLKGT
jgi:tetratricopeptide (TPR) repeat protein